MIKRVAYTTNFPLNREKPVNIKSACENAYALETILNLKTKAFPQIREKALKIFQVLLLAQVNHTLSYPKL